jgi:prefoldin subunit 5
MIGSTDVGNAQILQDQAKASEKVATMNSKAAVKTAEDTRDELTDRIVKLERAVNMLTQKCGELDRKYNLLISERFSAGPTS